MRTWRACTADYGHAGRSTWFRGIPDAPDNHSGRPGDRVWPRFPLILGSGGAQNGVGGFSGLPTSKFQKKIERVRLVAGEAASPATRRASGVIGKKLKAAERRNPRREKKLVYSYGAASDDDFLLNCTAVQLYSSVQDSTTRFSVFLLKPATTTTGTSRFLIIILRKPSSSLFLENAAGQTCVCA